MENFAWVQKVASWFATSDSKPGKVAGSDSCHKSSNKEGVLEILRNLRRTCCYVDEPAWKKFDDK